MMRSLLYPLGYPVRIDSESAGVLRIAAESWGTRSPLFEAQHFPLRIHVEQGPAPHRPPHYRVSPEGFSLTCDPITRGEFSVAPHAACLHVSSAALENADWFRHQLLECIVLTALDAIYFVGLHAACVVAPNGNGILVCGASGAGKTTLAYACARENWTFVCDDSHLAPGPENLVTGNTDKIRLREPARDLFPELSGAPIVTAPNGKTSIEVDPAQLARRSWAASAKSCVFLSRRPGRATLRRYPEACAVEYFMGYNTRYERAGVMQRLNEFTRGRTWLLEYESLEDAVRELERMS